MKCPGCGAALTSAMVAAGDCGYCGTHLPEVADKKKTDDLARAVAKLAEQQPKVVHVTKVEVRGPDIQVAGIFDSVTTRIAGCFTGCMSMGVTVGITLAILAFSAWQVWVSTRHIPTPHPSPGIEHPKPARGKR